MDNRLPPCDRNVLLYLVDLVLGFARDEDKGLAVDGWVIIWRPLDDIGVWGLGLAMLLPSIVRESLLECSIISVDFRIMRGDRRRRMWLDVLGAVGVRLSEGVIIVLHVFVLLLKSVQLRLEVVGFGCVD